MVPDGPRFFTEERESPEDPAADHRVALDQRVFLGGERSRFEQDGIGEHELAEVVQEPARRLTATRARAIRAPSRSPGVQGHRAEGPGGTGPGLQGLQAVTKTDMISAGSDSVCPRSRSLWSASAAVWA
jgi:hypothetical protein